MLEALAFHVDSTPLSGTTCSGSIQSNFSTVIALSLSALLIETLELGTAGLTSAKELKFKHCVRASGTADAAAATLLNNEFFIVLYLSIILLSPAVIMYKNCK